jgi:hypothetical protein
MLELRRVSKRFAGIAAVDNVSFWRNLPLISEGIRTDEPEHHRSLVTGSFQGRGRTMQRKPMWHVDVSTGCA